MKLKTLLRTITSEELADYLNEKGVNLNSFKCPVCHSEHSTLIDGQPLRTTKGELEIEGLGKSIMQPIFPTMLYPTISEFKKLDNEGKIPSQFQFLAEHLSHMSAANTAFLPVVHIICDNCGHIRSFRKQNILDWLSEKETL